MLRRISIAAVTAAAGFGAFAASAAADFGIVPGSLTTSLSGPTSGQAGSTGEFKLGFDMKTVDPNDPLTAPDGTIRDLELTLPKGMIANPTPFAPCNMWHLLPPASFTDPCPVTSAIGDVHMRVFNTGVGPASESRVKIYRVETQGDEAAAFAFPVFNSFPIRMAVTVDPENGYRVRTTGSTLNEGAPTMWARVTLWGVPAELQAPGPLGDFGQQFGNPLPPEEPRHRFLTIPTRCDGDPLGVDVSMRPWQTFHETQSYAAQLPLPTGCDQLPFDPTITVTPEHKRAGQPAGYKVELDVPQNTDPINGLETANLKDAVVALPKGVAISPPQANGLQACSDGQIDLNGKSTPTCPAASKIGEVVIDTPLLDDPVPGNIFIGSQESNDPMSGEMYRIFIAARAPGVRLKLKGQIRANPQTGQLETTFSDNPELPFSKFTLTFKGGDTAPLVNPGCGTHQTTSTLTPWGGPVANPSSSFTIDQGCATGVFAPGFNAGTTNPLAGSYAPFTMTATRTDGEQQLSRLNVEMPSGLLAALGSVPLCGAAEANAGTCSALSRIGSTTVDVGAGGSPYRLTGQVYVTGAYKGAPFGLSVVVPAKAGPFDLGNVVVRAALRVDANAAKVTAITDPFPEIVGGVPVSLRTVNVELDRPGFTFNATSCAPQQIHGAFWSPAGAGSTRVVGYQAQNCDKLKLSPRLALQWFGKSQMRKGKHPGVKAELGDMLGQANLQKVKVTLPLTAALDPGNAKALCEPSAAAANNCPADSRIGWASASTPALHERVEGPVYFVRGVRFSDTGREIGTLPKLYLPLSGQGVRVDLWADSDVDSKKRLVSTFMNIPDVPVRDFRLEINGGKNGILEATNDVCGASKTTTIEYSGHNGGVTRRDIAMTAPDCQLQIVAAENSRNVTLPVRVGGIGAGMLRLTGKGINGATRKVVRSDSALVRASFTQAAKRQLRAGKSLRTRLTVRYTPKDGKPISIRKTVTIKAVKR